MNVFLQLIKITSSSVEPGTDEKKKSKAPFLISVKSLSSCNP